MTLFPEVDRGCSRSTIGDPRSLSAASLNALPPNTAFLNELESAIAFSARTLVYRT